MSKDLIKKSNCGFLYNNKSQLYQHRIKCNLCKDLAKIGAPRNPNGWTARCGIVFDVRAELKNHYQICNKCLEIKKVNIRNRQLRHNQRPEQRAASSKAAMKTSQRPEIIKNRAANLNKWRLQNPEKFAETTRKAQLSSKKSKFEMWMSINTLIDFKPQRIECQKDRKYVDFIKEDIWIEIDGPHHFFQIYPHRPLSCVQDRDILLNNECIRRQSITLIRIGVDCFIASTGRFKDEWNLILLKMLQAPIPGIWCLGRLYEYALWAKEGCTILKLPRRRTISAYLMV